MALLLEDPRWLNDEYLIDFQWKKIAFFDMVINADFARSIEMMVQWNNYFVWEKAKKISFSPWIEIFDVPWNTFVLEFDDTEKRDMIMKSLRSHYRPTKYFSEVMEKDRQIPSIQWYFDHEWSSYIIVNARNKLTEETDPSKGIYQWVIVEPLQYFGWDETQWLQKNISDRIALKIET